MEIRLFAKCIKDLIVENDRVDVPYLGAFTAELMPATYSDRQTTIHPPYRKMSFHKCEVSLAEGRLLLDKVRRELGVNLDQAGVELGWCLSRLNSELEGRKRCALPGLGMMRANARNEFFFVPDDDLDIWPDGIGFEPIAIKMPKDEMPDQVGHDEEEMPDQVGQDVASVEEEKTRVVEAVVEPVVEAVVEPAVEPVVEPVAEPAAEPVVEAVAEAGVREPGGDTGVSLSETRRACETPDRQGEARRKKALHPVWIVLIVLAALLVLFIAASYLFTEQLSPILDRLLYSKEELELLQWRRV